MVEGGFPRINVRGYKNNSKSEDLLFKTKGKERIKRFPSHVFNVKVIEPHVYFVRAIESHI